MFWALLNEEPGDAEQFWAAERAKHRGACEPVREEGKRLVAFVLERAAERVRVLPQPFEADLSVQRRLRRGQPTQLDRRLAQATTLRA